MKIKFFHCHELGHYTTKCPHNKASKNPSGGVASEALASQFELDFTLIAYMARKVMGSVWQEFFGYLEEKDLQMHIEMGDDGSLAPLSNSRM